ncbi:MAG: penicillin-binding protein activator LpoB [Spirochaetaceae bacterium]|nr:penicillin-binding protein activator LpoB [Spirochaetaceae bacterium]
MKKTFVCILTAIAVFSLSACATKVTRVGASQQRDLSGRWSMTDVREMAGSLLNDCLASSRVDRLVQDWRRGHRGQNPKCIVGVFRNTSSEHIDTNILSDALETAIMNSDRLDFVASGDMREQLRNERQEQQTNASEATAARLANETGAAFMLSGTVQSMLDSEGSRSFRNYIVNAQLANVETSEVVWRGRAEVTKEIIRSKSRA